MGHYIYGMELHSPKIGVEKHSQNGLLAFFKEGFQFMKKEIPFFATALLIGVELLDDAKNVVFGIIDHIRAAIDDAGIFDWIDGIDSDDLE